jgi:hypothetical protein
MPFGRGLNKNRHGTYEARKKVPQHLEEAVARVLDNGKPKQVWLKRTLATKDHTEAKRRVKAVQIEFDRILERAQELVAERPLLRVLKPLRLRTATSLEHTASTSKQKSGQESGLRRSSRNASSRCTRV